MSTKTYTVEHIIAKLREGGVHILGSSSGIFIDHDEQA